MEFSEKAEILLSHFKTRIFMIRISLIMLLFFTASVHSMDFRYNVGFQLRGEIQKGDFNKFKNAFAMHDKVPNYFLLESHGGDVNEAMLMGRFIRESQIPVRVENYCDSACFFIYAAGVERKSSSKIGLHRPYYGKSYFAGLTSTQAQEKYNSLDLKIRLYLRDMGVSDNITNRMFATPSNKIYYVNKEEAEFLLGFRAPFYGEWLLAKCEPLTDKERQVEMSMVILGMYNNRENNSKNYSSEHVNDLKSYSKLARDLEKSGDLDVYSRSIGAKRKCHDIATDEHQSSFYIAFQDEWLLDENNFQKLESHRKKNYEYYYKIMKQIRENKNIK